MCRLVKTQVESQIKGKRAAFEFKSNQTQCHTDSSCVFLVRDLSKTTVSISPAEYGSWADARAELISEAKRPLKAQLESELAAAQNEDEVSQIRAAFAQKETAMEVILCSKHVLLILLTRRCLLCFQHEIDHKPMDMHLSMSVAYK